MQSKQQNFFNGRMVAIARGKRALVGEAVVSVQADGLAELRVPGTQSDTQKFT